MAFDQSLDKELWSSDRTFFDKTKIIVSVRSYNNGRPKIQISRSNNSDDRWVFAKLGRLTKDEAEALVEMINEAKEHM